MATSWFYDDDPWRWAPAWAIALRSEVRALRYQLKLTETADMATQQTLEALTASVKSNTDATAAAADALRGFAVSQAELTAKLEAAIANSEASDNTEVQAAVDAINANNSALLAAVPAVAAAVVENTAPTA